ncbi:hypothetical protein CLA18_30125 [Pseudomonas protegens]|nr:hypothetical protein CLA18_30125 [Pseudomonas protegens]
MGTQGFAVQGVALEVADQVAIEVDLVQVAAAVIELVELASVGQGQPGEVAQGVVVVGKLAGAAASAQQLNVGVVLIMHQGFERLVIDNPFNPTQVSFVLLVTQVQTR